MAHWKEAVVTDSGTELLNEWMAGRKLTVTNVYGGTGTVDAELLHEQTGLVDQKQVLSLMGKSGEKNGVTVQVQVSNRELEAEYELNQVAVFAALDRDKDPTSPERLLFIMQDEKGVNVPDKYDEVFVLELYCAIGITNNGRFIVTVDTTGLVTIGHMNESIIAAILAHNNDPDAHGGSTGGAHVAEVEITIPETGWRANEDEDEEPGLLHVDVEIEEVRESQIPWLSIAPKDRNTAKLCGMTNEPRTMDGIIRVYAVTAPAAAVEARVALLGTGGSTTSGGYGGEYILPAASATRLGGAKIGAAGTGLKMGPDGTASVNWEDMDAAATAAVAAKAAEKIVPSEEEVDEMLDENFQPYDPGQDPGT